MIIPVAGTKAASQPMESGHRHTVGRRDMSSRRFLGLSQQIAYYVAVHIREPVAATLMFEGQPFVIQAQQM